MTTTETTPETEAPKARRPLKPNYYGQPEGRAAVDGFACPACKARKGTKCANAAGEPTNYVHPGRLAKFTKAAAKAAT